MRHESIIESETHNKRPPATLHMGAPTTHRHDDSARQSDQSCASSAIVLVGGGRSETDFICMVFTRSVVVLVAGRRLEFVSVVGMHQFLGLSAFGFRASRHELL